jgi:hypothetical protein
MTTYVRTPATRSPDDGVALADLAMECRELQHEVAVIDLVPPDDATNDDAQTAITSPIHAEQADPQRDVRDERPEDKVGFLNQVGAPDDDAQHEADRETNVTRWGAESRMREQLAFLPPGVAEKRRQMEARLDDHISPEGEEEDSDIITPPITPVATQQDASSQDSGAFLMGPGTENQFYEIRMMVCVGYVTSCNVPARLEGAPEPCLVRRRIVRDMDDNNKTLEDTYTVLYTREHFSRRRCDLPHLLEVALIYCDHPQYNVTRTAEMATPGAVVGIGSKTKIAHDFGVRRWLADTGCGHDLVASSVVVEAGGEDYIQVKPPKYLNTASGVAAVTKGVTMCIPQLDEMTDIMCLSHSPSVLSIGGLCVTMGYAYFWPPYSEHPFFAKPDGSRVTVDVVGNKPYLAGGNLEDFCPAVQRDGPDTDNEDPDVEEMPRNPVAGRCVWEFEGGVDVHPPAQDYPPTPPDDDTLEPPDSPQNTISRPWPQTRWSEDHSPTNG